MFFAGPRRHRRRRALCRGAFCRHMGCGWWCQCRFRSWCNKRGCVHGRHAGLAGPEAKYPRIKNCVYFAFFWAGLGTRSRIKPARQARQASQAGKPIQATQTGQIRPGKPGGQPGSPDRRPKPGKPDRQTNPGNPDRANQTRQTGQPRQANSAPKFTPVRRQPTGARSPRVCRASQRACMQRGTQGRPARKAASAVRSPPHQRP